MHQRACDPYESSQAKGECHADHFAVLCGCGHNIRKILAHLRAWLAAIIIAVILGLVRLMQDSQSGYAAA